MSWMSARLTHLLSAQTIPGGRHGQADDEISGDDVGHEPFVIGNAPMGPEWTVLQRVNARIHGPPHAFHTVYVHRHLFAHAMRIVRHSLESGRIVLRRLGIGPWGGVASSAHELYDVHIVFHQRTPRLLQFVHPITLNTVPPQLSGRTGEHRP